MDAEELNPLLSEDELQKVSTMNESIKCPNQECRAENPACAKFCRVCGQPIIVDYKGYTLEMFQDIELIPVSLKPIQFVTKMEKASYVLLPILIISLLLICYDLKRDFIGAFGRDAFEVTTMIGIVLSFIFAICFIIGLRQFWKQIRYKANADYIEDYYESNSDYYYIVKNGKFGIIYWKREKHWYGDTVDYHRVISCQYDRIDKEEEHFICYSGSERLFMDLKGNILK